MNRTFLGLGSNLGNRFATILGAIEHLKQVTTVTRISPIYESEAHLFASDHPQPPYLNSVVAIKTNLTPKELLETCLAIETTLGRVRDSIKRWQPRTLDIDVLAFEDSVINTPSLTVPHPLLAQRKFVLSPWKDIAPAFLIPAPYNQTVETLFNHCEDSNEITIIWENPSIFLNIS